MELADITKVKDRRQSTSNLSEVSTTTLESTCEDLISTMLPSPEPLVHSNVVTEQPE